MQRRDFTALLAAGLIPASWMSPALAAEEGPALKVLGAAKGLRVGNAIGMKTFADPLYRALMLRECSAMVTENECKWPSVSPSAGAWRFGPADELLGWGGQQGLQRRGHCLVWQPAERLPEWVNAFDFSKQPTAAAEKLLIDRIQGMCTRYGTQIYSWDVVNEAVDPATGDYRVNVLTQALGAVEQIDLCFHLARVNAPQTQLVYNDYMRWDAGSAKHRAGVLKLLTALKKRGTPIDALGLQSHIGSWDEAGAGEAPQRAWRQFLDEVSALGLNLLITEFDVNDRKLPADVATRDAGVAALARDYLDVCFSYPNLHDFIFWGLTDSSSWLQTWNKAPRTDGLAMRPCPYDEHGQPKPLREAVAAAIRAMPQRAAV